MAILQLLVNHSVMMEIIGIGSLMRHWVALSVGLKPWVFSTRPPAGEMIDGLFIREFTNGWAVYNRSGKAQEIVLPQEVSGSDSGVENKRRHTLPDLDGEIYLKVETTPTADVNEDGVVNIQDLVIVANALGKAEPDLNGDGIVNIQDLVIVANAF